VPSEIRPAPSEIRPHAGADPKAVAQCLKAKLGLPAVRADLVQGSARGMEGTGSRTKMQATTRDYLAFR
jgi:hypothetical protein